jgi:long-chain acyl-CoA synthetase
MSTPESGTPEYWATQRPDAAAVICGETVLTYRDWNDAADRVAEGLAALGLRAGDRIGMRFRLSVEWFVIQRALQKLQVAQVAVNWRLTPDEALYILRDSGAKGLACNDVDVSGWAGHDVGVLVTVGQSAAASGVRYEDLLTTPPTTPRYGPARPALVLYTSGTTGRPRGVPPLDPSAITDPDRLVRYMMSVTSVPPYPDNSTTLLTMPIHHGAGPQIAAATCAKGGTVVVLDPFDPEEALRLIDKHKVHAWISVPTMLLRIQKLPDGVIERYDLSSLQSLGTGAAPVPQSLKEWVVKRFGDDVLWEVYGASEAGMISYASPQHQLSKPGTSGRPYDGAEVAIVDQDWNRLPAGELGEIAVNTPVVLRNYLGGRWLLPHRRCRLPRRRRLPVHHRPHQRHDRRGRGQHLSRRNREGTGGTPAGRRRRGNRCPRRRFRREAAGFHRHQTRHAPRRRRPAIVYPRSSRQVQNPPAVHLRRRTATQPGWQSVENRSAPALLDRTAAQCLTPSPAPSR